jgi:hypothetical protein
VDGPAARVVLLGASNLTRGISTVAETARLMLGGPLEMFAALGYGRSYGMRSRVLLRSLPGIAECGLWEALGPQSKAMPTYALITDVGNDILYGAEPEQIVGWVTQCLDRLEDHDARTVITQLPMGSIRTVSRWKYRLVRTILFPGCRLAYGQAMARAGELDERLRDLTARRGVLAVEMDGAWYGLDHIHIRMRSWKQAWGEILTGWGGTDRICQAPGSLRRWAVLRRAEPERWWLMGRLRHKLQPAVYLPDGTGINLF